MIWSEFVTDVYAQMPRDATRLNVGVTSAQGEPWAKKIIRNGVGDLQRFIPAYQIGHETIYGPDDLTIEGKAQNGSLPAGAQFRMAYYVRTGHTCCRLPFTPYPGGWANRFDLVCGLPAILKCQFYMVIDPYGTEFTIFPQIEEGYEIDVFWDGIKLDFADGDLVPFDNPMVNAVALYTRAHIEREVNRSPDGFVSYMGTPSGPMTGTYYYERQQLHLTGKKRSELKEIGDSPQPLSTCAACSCEDTGNDIEWVAMGDGGNDETYEGNIDTGDTKAVADLAKELEPEFIVHLGDTAIPMATPDTFYEQFVRFYEVYIHEESLYLARGNHDPDTVFNTLAYLKTLNSGLFYYKFTQGCCEFFVLDSEGDVTVQNTWLQAALTASTATWKIVCLHKSPYNSESTHTPGDLTWRLDYSKADVVFAAHAHLYERLLIGGVTYIVAGTAGNTLRDYFIPQISGSQHVYYLKHGLVHCTANTGSLSMRFVTVDKTEIDRVVLHK